MAKLHRDLDEITFKELISLTLRSWMWIGLASVLSCLGVWAQFLEQPLYTSTAMLSVQESSKSPMQAMTAQMTGFQSGGDKKALEPFLDYINTPAPYVLLRDYLYQNELQGVLEDFDMSHNGLVARLNRLTGVQLNPIQVAKPSEYSASAVERMIKANLKSKTVGTDTISLSLKSSDPKTSILLVNLLLQFTADAIVARDLKELDESRLFIQSQLDDIETKVQRIQDKIIDLQQTHARLTNNMGDRETASTLTKIKLEMTEAETQILQTQKLIKEIESKNTKDFVSRNRHSRLVQELTFAQSRLSSLTVIHDELVSAKKQMPNFEQAVQSLMREREFEYTFLGELKSQLLQIEVQRISLQNKVRAIEAASVNTTFRTSFPMKKMVLASMVATILVIILMYVLEHMAPVIRDRKDLNNVAMQYVGSVPDLTQKGVRAWLGGAAPTTTIDLPFPDIIQDSRSGTPQYDETHAYVFGSVRSKIIHYMDHVDKNLKVLAMMSPRSGDGKTLISARLAVSFTQINKRVLLMDTDLIKRDLSYLLGHADKNGLSDLLRGEGRLEDFLIHIDEFPNLKFLPAGPYYGQTADMLLNGRIDELVDRFRGEYDMIIMDTPALLVAHDAIVASKLSDLIVVSLSENKTRIEDVDRVVEELQYSASGREVGYILNRSGKMGEYYYYYTDGKRRSA